ncbi:40-kDa huntingtin-associated protein-like [Bacillus rossius redtenbacheri]|uniref:40-kDa huntingtin-associated protein-like n=1 Tax=Bacillus rossius redtenbacheri TaxID=93214 RepID=UPI002FDE71AF
MADSGSSDILSQYRSVSNKLKKRFLRKPNVTEASNQFGQLAARCEREDLPQYAGLCWIAAARCEGSLGNAPGEAWDLLRAGRKFLEAEAGGEALGCPRPGGEHLQAAVSCYAHAAGRWQAHHAAEGAQASSPLAAGLALELGQALAEGLGRPEEAASQFRRAADAQRCSPLGRLASLRLLASCKMQLGDYDGALAVLEEASLAAEQGGGPAVGTCRDALRDCEVTRVLLLLVLQPVARRLPPDLAAVLERYAWVEDVSVPVSYLSEDEFLLLQSLVMACQSRDVDSLRSLEPDLWPRLSTEQRDLLRALVVRVGRSAR